MQADHTRRTRLPWVWFCRSLVVLGTTIAAAAAPSLVMDINATVSPSPLSPSSLTNTNGTLFFVAQDDIHGGEIWKSDSTPSGTVMVKDVNPGTTGTPRPPVAGVTVGLVARAPAVLAPLSINVSEHAHAVTATTTP